MTLHHIISVWLLSVSAHSASGSVMQPLIFCTGTKTYPSQSCVVFFSLREADCEVWQWGGGRTTEDPPKSRTRHSQNMEFGKCQGCYPSCTNCTPSKATDVSLKIHEMTNFCFNATWATSVDCDWGMKLQSVENRSCRLSLPLCLTRCFVEWYRRQSPTFADTVHE